MAKTNAKMFSTGYRFRDGGEVTAILDEDGKLSLKDDSGGLELFQNWGDYVSTVTGEKPTKSGEDDVIAQLGVTLGVPEEIIVDAGESRRPRAEPMNGEKGEATMAVNKKVKGTGATAKPVPAKKSGKDVKPVKKAALKRPVSDESLPDCLCGCGSKVMNAARQFLQGHDARFHGYVKKIERGDMKASELTPAGRAWLKDHGITPGSNKER